MTPAQRKKARRLLLGISGGTMVTWTPADIVALQAWGSGSSIDPQSAGTDNLVAWNAADGAPNCSTLNGSPNVVAAGSSFAVEFVASQSARAIATGATITKAASGYLWAVFKLRAGASTGANHGLVSIGTSGSGNRRCELKLQTVSSSLRVGFFVNEGAGNTRNIYSTATIADTNWHSAIIEHVGAGTHRLFIDEVEIAGGSLTNSTSGTPPNWLSSWNAIYSPDRMGVGCSVLNATPSEHGDVVIRDWGVGSAAIADEANLLAYLAALRA